MSLDDEKRRTLVRLYWDKATRTLDEYESAVRDEKVINTEFSEDSEFLLLLT